MYNIIRIHKPIKEYPCALEMSTLSTIPEFLRKAITIQNHELWLDTIDGYQVVPVGSVIGYEKCDHTASGYNCWFIANSKDLVKINGIFYTKPVIIHGLLIPAQEDPQPVWVHSCNLTYNGDGTATLNTDSGKVSGRIGIDFILSHGMKKDGKPNASILTTFDEDYNDYTICDENGNDIGKLSEIYPA